MNKSKMSSYIPSRSYMSSDSCYYCDGLIDVLIWDSVWLDVNDDDED